MTTDEEKKNVWSKRGKGLLQLEKAWDVVGI